MAISYPLTFPSTGIAQITLTARNSVAISSSPFTYRQQVQKNVGSRWEATITLPSLIRANADVWVAFLLSLGGQYGTFLMGDPIAATPRGSASTTPGTPLVNGSSQSGGTVAVDGLPVSTANYLRAGDYIQLGSGATSQLYKVLEDVESNSSGEANISIWPDLRSSPADNLTVVVQDAVGVFRLSSPETSFNIDTASVYGISFAAVEAL
jgi:hypothetical protein